MNIHFGKEWNETVLVNIGGKSASSKEWVPTVIHHGIYTGTDILIIVFLLICVLLMFYFTFKNYKKR
jgi:hypothetical protein